MKTMNATKKDYCPPFSQEFHLNLYVGLCASSTMSVSVEEMDEQVYDWEI